MCGAVTIMGFQLITHLTLCGQRQAFMKEVKGVEGGYSSFQSLLLKLLDNLDSEELVKLAEAFRTISKKLIQEEMLL